MKAVVLTGIKQMELRDVADPDIRNDDDVLLKIEKVGVCGSDVHYYEAGRIGSQAVQYPYIIGHECAATVEAVAGAVDSFKVGDQVVVDPAVPCHNCDQCRAGRENTCRNLSFLGTPGEGEGCLLGDDGISEGSISVHPVGNPINHSFQSGFTCPPICLVSLTRFGSLSIRPPRSKALGVANS